MANKATGIREGKRKAIVRNANSWQNGEDLTGERSLRL